MAFPLYCCIHDFICNHYDGCTKLQTVNWWGRLVGRAGRYWDTRHRNMGSLGRQATAYHKFLQLCQDDYRRYWRRRYVSYLNICCTAKHVILFNMAIISYRKGQDQQAYIFHRISSPNLIWLQSHLLDCMGGSI